jgi:hypothetical protein
MKFTPLEDIKAKGRLYEAGSPCDSEKQGIPNETVERWYASGWCEIEGREPAPERKVRGVVVRPHTAKHQHKEQSNG